MLTAGGFLSSTFDAPVTQPSSAKLALLLGFTVFPALLMLASLPVLRAFADARRTTKVETIAA